MRQDNVQVRGGLAAAVARTFTPAEERTTRGLMEICGYSGEEAVYRMEYGMR